MVIKNGLVLNSNFVFEKTEIEFDEKILSIGVAGSCCEVFDAENCYVVPGLVDTHMHAAVGETFIDFNHDTARKICSFEAERGTTSLVPAISAAPEEKMKAATRYIVEKSKEALDAKLLGVHLEGPFFAQKYKGAHLPENIRIPSTEEASRLVAAGEGMVKIITMAPELENGFETVEWLAGQGVTVSVGHSDASYDQALEAFSRGATQTTHTFNAMSSLNHRAPGIPGAAMLSENVQCELICDFFHIHKDIVKLMFKIKGADKITMITDSEVGTGMPDGKFEVNGRTLTVSDGKTFTEDGTIAGGTSVLLDGVKNLVSIGIPLEQALKTASINGAKAAHIDSCVGSLEQGKDADILVLDRNLDIKAVFVNGQKIK